MAILEEDDEMKKFLVDLISTNEIGNDTQKRLPSAMRAQKKADLVSAACKRIWGQTKLSGVN